MKKYKYINCNKLENYDDWDIVQIIEAQSPNTTDMVVIMKEDKPIQAEVYLSQATNQELLEEIKRRLGVDISV